MKTNNKYLAVLILLVALVLINFIASRIPGQIDLTQSKRYTLSAGSKQLLDKLEEPVQLKFFFSKGIGEIPIHWKNYAEQIKELLGQYVSHSNGLIELEIIDPRPDTNEEEAAIRAGLNGQQVTATDRFFFGLQAILADQEECISLFSFEREKNLEYDISDLIYRVQGLEKSKIAVISSLPLFGSPVDPMMTMQMPQKPQAWIFIQQLQNNYEVIEITDEKIPEDTDLLMLIHPKELSTETEFAIDQFILSGKPCYIAIDPSCLAMKQQNANSIMGIQESNSSDLQKLFESYEIEYNPTEVLGDIEYALNVGQMGNRMPTYIAIEQFESTSPIAAELNSLWFLETGSFKLKEGSSHELTPLASSSKNSDTLHTSILAHASAQLLQKEMNPDDTIRHIAGVITGHFKSAFPNGKPQEKGSQTGDSVNNTDSIKEGDGNIILIADTDYLVNEFSVQVVNILGQQALSPLNDNIALTNNIVDFFCGSQDLISLRTKGSSSHPFTLVQQISFEAEQRYQVALEEAEGKLNRVKAELAQLVTQQQGEQNLIVSPEITQSIEDYQNKEADLQKEIRLIRKKLREDIEELKLSLSLINLLSVPILIAIFAFVNFYIRNKRPSIK